MMFKIIFLQFLYRRLRNSKAIAGMPAIWKLGVKVVSMLTTSFGSDIYRNFATPYLYDVSDRRIEEEVNFNLVLKWFIGLAIDESPPDASSLTRFRDRLGGSSSPTSSIKLFSSYPFHDHLARSHAKMGTVIP